MPIAIHRLILVFIVAGVLSSVVCGQKDAPSLQATELGASSHPNLGRGPTDVAIAVFIVDVRRVIDVEQTMNIDFVIESSWTDPRMAREGAAATAEIRKIPLDQLWHPALNVVNIARIFPQFPSRVFVDDAGDCVHMQRYVGTVTCPLDLRDFPLDEQVLALQIISLMHSPQEVRLIPDLSLCGRATNLSVVDWKVGAATFEAQPVQLREDGMAMAGFRVSMPAKRYATYYILKVITPLLLIVAMSWSVFWIDPKQAGTQISIAATSLLTMIAYRFLLGNLLPKVSYLTRLDIFIFGSTFIVFFMLAHALYTANLAHRDNLRLAQRLDRAGRLISPVILFALLVFAFLL